MKRNAYYAGWSETVSKRDGDELRDAHAKFGVFIDSILLFFSSSFSWFLFPFHVSLCLVSLHSRHLSLFSRPLFILRSFLHFDLFLHLLVCVLRHGMWKWERRFKGDKTSVLLFLDITQWMMVFLCDKTRFSFVFVCLRTNSDGWKWGGTTFSKSFTSSCFSSFRWCATFLVVAKNFLSSYFSSFLLIWRYLLAASSPKAHTWGARKAVGVECESVVFQFLVASSISSIMSQLRNWVSTSILR